MKMGQLVRPLLPAALKHKVPERSSAREVRSRPGSAGCCAGSLPKLRAPLSTP